MDRNILVIGGNSGVGLEITRQLTEAGDRVRVAARRGDEGKSRPDVTYQTYDAADPAAILELPELLDALVYCPGTILLKPFHRLSDADFQEDLDVNFFGAVRAIRQALPNLKRAEAPSILLFSSVAAGTGLPFHASIASAKGAVEGLTRSLAAEFAPKIRVNCLSLSLTDTPLAASLLNSQEKSQSAKDRHPLKRIGSVEEVAGAARFVLGPSAAFMTGQVLSLDGGIGAVRQF
jgi:3-oxoacyl-[acyl-carrier protein] reductase